MIIEDRSKYGTFVNGVLVGKGCTAPLVHGDTLSLLAPAPPDGIRYTLQILQPDPEPSAGSSLDAGRAPVAARGGVTGCGCLGLPPGMGRHGSGISAAASSSAANCDWPIELDGELNGELDGGVVAAPPHPHAAQRRIARAAACGAGGCGCGGGYGYGCAGRDQHATPLVCSDTRCGDARCGGRRVADSQYVLPPPAPLPPRQLQPELTLPLPLARQTSAEPHPASSLHAHAGPLSVSPLQLPLRESPPGPPPMRASAAIPSGGIPSGGIPSGGMATTAQGGYAPVRSPPPALPPPPIVPPLSLHAATESAAAREPPAANAAALAGSPSAAPPPLCSHSCVTGHVNGKGSEWHGI